jgi:two-component system, NtrC family, response regulator
MEGKILLIDDETELRKLLSRLLDLEGYKVITAPNGAKALSEAEHEDFDVVITDVRLPDISGLELVSKIKAKQSYAEIIVLTAYGTIEDGVKAIKDGAFDYITKGDEDNKIIPLVARAMEKVQFRKRIDSLEKSVGEKYSFENITGTSKIINQAKELAKKIAETDTPVLLLGETGTGKELFAQAIHYTGSRKNKPFVAINCSAIAKDLLESEMFGYKAGAFTGAVKNKKGLFEEANGGTLFLDEIGDLDISLQAKLLRVLESNEFIKTGDTKPTQVDVRIITATNKNPEAEVAEGNFRSDLYYRIAVMKIELPSLRERQEDIRPLTEYFINLYSKRLKRNITNINDSFFQILAGYAFPGNIRELRNIIERAVILSENGLISERTLPKELFNESHKESGTQLKLEDVEKNYILSVLEKAEGNKTKAAELLGIGLTTLYRKLQTYGIE